MMILDHQARTYKYQGAREGDIMDELGLTPTHFYQQLNQLIDTEAAIAYAPMLVGRLRAKRVNRRGPRR